MKISAIRFTNKLVSSLLLLVLLSCVGGGESEAIGDSFETDPSASGSVVNGICYEDQYATPEEYITRKLDIAIVIDTSGSIVDERASIADGFDYFISQIPEEVDVQIAVILAHGEGQQVSNFTHPASQNNSGNTNYLNSNWGNGNNGQGVGNTGPGNQGNSSSNGNAGGGQNTTSNSVNWSGKLYKKSTEPVILKTSELTREEIKTYLRAKMQNPATDNETDGGELGLYSLQKALTVNLSSIQTQGFFRTDAALAVVFVADEQDICAKYPEGVVPVIDTNNIEPVAFNKYCVDSSGNYLITPENTFDLIKNVQGDNPLVVGGVIYVSNQTMPIGGENEIGYGYKETIELAGGIKVDMANGDYSNGLANLGKMAITSLKPANDFNLKTAKVDENTIEVRVDGTEVDFSYSVELNQVHLTQERGNFSVANLKYCEKPELPKVARQVVAAGYHSCALLVSGEVKCWGRNNVGQLGLGHLNSLGDNENVSSANLVPIGEKVIELSAGLQHTCALLESGSVKCWGDNSKGQLGQGHMSNIGDNETPADITAINFGVTNKVKKIYSGTRYNCALFDNLKIKCWGENLKGQLGYGHINTVGDDENLSTIGYVSVGANVVQMDISNISQHTCAVLDSGDMKCWGWNAKGQLGYGHMNDLGDNELPSSIPVIPFGQSILQVATGNVHTCAVIDGQNLRCWGDNTNGQIGLGVLDTIGDNEAANSVGVLQTGANGIAAVATGNNHTCAISTDSDLYCFGLNTQGQLGLGHTNKIGDDEAIVNISKVNLPVTVSQVSTGLTHTCALTKDEGKVICFGQNTYGQLGLGNVNTIGDNELASQFVALE